MTIAQILKYRKILLEAWVFIRIITFHRDWGGPLLEARFLGNLFEKSAFLVSKLGSGSLLEF